MNLLKCVNEGAAFLSPLKELTKKSDRRECIISTNGRENTS